MTTKAQFNADEWETVVQAPLLAAVRVIKAERGGTIRESLAVGQTYAEARRQQGESELLDELVASPPALDPSHIEAPDDIASLTTERLGEALRLLEQKASPDEVQAYKRFVLSAAEAAAKAHKEGGFMGVGGKQVGEGEQAALDEIAATLQLAPSG